MKQGIDTENDPNAKRQKTADSGNSDLDFDEKITRQIDYYFSDVNVMKDKFLLEEFKKNKGWVKLSTLLTFVRLKQLTKEEEKLVEALKKIESKHVELDEEGRQVRRKNPLPENKEEFQKQVDLRTVHVSGFPTSYEFEELSKFCNQFGVVESVAMRRHFKTRFFKGCIHVVFQDQADAKKLLETEPLMCKDRELKKESMEQYYKRKDEMKQKKRNKMKDRKKKTKG